MQRITPSTWNHLLSDPAFQEVHLDTSSAGKLHYGLAARNWELAPSKASLLEEGRGAPWHAPGRTLYIVW